MDDICSKFFFVTLQGALTAKEGENFSLLISKKKTPNIFLNLNQKPAL